ncbi:LicD family protein [Leucobacter sp. HY1908]
MPSAHTARRLSTNVSTNISTDFSTKESLRVRATVTRRGVRFAAEAGTRPPTTLNVEFAGRRIWSLEAPTTRKRAFVPWPRSLRERLRGSEQVRLVDAGSGDLVWQGTLRWRGSGHPDLTDERGRDVAVNKWGLMRHTFDGDLDMRQRVADSAVAVLDVMQEAGYTAFVVGGTLLGAVRDGEILPHDDDADLAYLSPHTHPSDLVTENHALAELLIARGFRVLRHSWSHLQVLRGSATEVDYYVDIFTAFYKHNHFHEPIHVRAPGLEDAILPLGEVMMHGHTFPAPRDPDAWLTACYGPTWRSPDPSFKFETPLATRRRFYSWFGAYGFGRNAWEDGYHDGATAHETSSIRPYVLKAAAQLGAAGESVQVLDLGAGSGQDAAFYRAAGLSCHTSDFAFAAPVLHEPAPHTGTRVNLVERIDVMRYIAGKLPEAEHSIITVNHVFAALGGVGLETALQVLAAAARAGARVFTADYESLGKYHPELPRTWHLEWPTFEAAATHAGLTATLLTRAVARDEDGVRRDYFVAELTSASAPASASSRIRKELS